MKICRLVLSDAIASVSLPLCRCFWMDWPLQNLLFTIFKHPVSCNRELGLPSTSSHFNLEWGRPNLIVLLRLRTLDWNSFNAWANPNFFQKPNQTRVFCVNMQRLCQPPTQKKNQTRRERPPAARRYRMSPQFDCTLQHYNRSTSRGKCDISTTREAAQVTTVAR